MKVDKVLSRFAENPDADGELRRLARALGDEMSRHRLRVMRKFRAGLARVKMTQERSFAAGYVASLLDVVAEYEVSVTHASNEKELQRLAVREEWRDLLHLLRDGPKLPSELALGLSRDRPSITRALKRLRTAGLVQAFADESLDGRMRPHRLTLDGRRLLDKMQSDISDEVERGISIAVSLFGHLATNASSAANELDALAESILDDPQAATAAVRAWARRAQDAGLVAELSSSRIAAAAAAAAAGPRYHLAAPSPAAGADAALLDPRSDALWHGVPDILTQISDRKGDDVPVYVRTTRGAWGAWAHGLQGRDATGMSRAIVEGDLLTGSVAPPDRRFDLVYDDPAMVREDREKPTMQAFMAQADEKFIVSAGEDASESDVPEGFIQLTLGPGNDE